MIGSPIGSPENGGVDLKRLLRKADIRMIACIDERRSNLDAARYNPVNLPGATEIVVDAIKFITHSTEDQAWERIQKAGIPIAGHIDDHQGIEGCGYRKLVANLPEAVGAPEAVPAKERYDRIVNLGGQILTYYGDHIAGHAVMNYVRGKSIDQDQMPQEGIFSADLWAVEAYAKKLKLDGKRMVAYVEFAFRGAVTTLTNHQINKFEKLRSRSPFHF